MKSFRIVTAIVAIILLMPAAWAVEMAGKLSASPIVGVVIPMGDAAETDPDADKAFGATSGFCVGGALEYGLTENVMVGGKFLYNRMGFDDALLESELPEGATIDNANWKIIEFGAYVKLLMMAGKPTRPYIRGGVIMGKADLNGDVMFEGETFEGKDDISNALGLEGAVGVLHMFYDKMGGFVEGGLTHLMTDGKDVEAGIDDDIETGEVEGNFQWIGVRAGVTIFFGN